MFFVVLCLGAPEGSTGSVSGLKHLRRWGRGLKSHPTDWWSCTFFFAYTKIRFSRNQAHLIL